MIENYDTEEFERTLKEHADRFFLIPSERVWKSIYNDIHPGSRWPSLAVGLFMLLTLFWIGNVNQDNQNGSILVSTDKTIDVQTTAPGVQGDKTSSSLIQKSITQGRFERTQPSRITHNNLIVNKQRDYLPATIAFNQSANSIVSDRDTEDSKIGSDQDLSTINSPNPVDNAKLNSNETKPTASTTGKVREVKKDISSDLKLNTTADREPSLKLNSGIRKKLKWEFTFMPIISDVKFMGANLNKVNSTVVNTPVSKHDMNIAKRLGFITGTNVYYPLSNKISLTSGVHLVYTGYDIFSEVVQPNTTSLTFKDSKGQMFSKYYVSYYANDKRNNNTSITNYNWQLSVPVGLQWEVISGGKMKVSLISTVEPFMVLGNKAYLLSGDASSYVTDPDLVRKFNLSGNIGGFVHLSSNTANWKIGPNFRYQILSTYNDIYPVKEHFINYGIQLGVSRK